MLKRFAQIIAINLLGFAAIGAGFTGLALAAGGFGAHTLFMRLGGSLISFGIAVALVALAYMISNKDADTMVSSFIIGLLLKI